MPLAIPPEMKSIMAYVRRAEELDADTTNPDARIVAYYCRSYAANKALTLRQANSPPSVNEFLNALITSLEQSNVRVAMEVGKDTCERYVRNLFATADEEDRSGLANRDTAKTFYNASNFFDIMEQFGEVDEELQQMNKYSKWKAAEIMKALKEGRTPEPGGFGESRSAQKDDDDDGIPSAPSGPSIGLPSLPNLGLPSLPPPSYSPSPVSPPSNYSSQPYNSNPPNAFQAPPQAPYYPPNPPQYQQPPANPPQYQQPPANSPQYQQPPSQPLNSPQPQYTQSHHPATPVVTQVQGKKSVSALEAANKDAVELAQFAIAALKQNDVKLARDRLQEALRRLS